MIDNISSEFLPGTSGVPQGSILGPLLFLIFIILDMPNVISRETSLPLFADDSKCFRLILGWKHGDELQDDLNNLLTWSNIWGMEFDTSKCKVLRVARVKSVLERDYYLGESRLDRVVVEKDLGVLIRRDLSWNDHVDFITGKAHKMLRLLYRTCRDISDVSIKRILYITWVRSRLEYASVVWSPYTKRNITRLQRVQTNATRFIIGSDYSE